MARVHTAKAAKDYPDHGIKKGDVYFYWQLYKSPKQISKTHPRPSQLTNSKLSAAYAAREALEDGVSEAKDPQTLIDLLNDTAEAIRGVASEYEDAISNLPDSLQQGPNAEEWQEKADALESYASALEESATSIEQMDIDEYTDPDFVREEKPAEFDDLNDDEKAAFMESAREEALSASLEV